MGITGVALVALGIICISSPISTVISMAWILGIITLVSGISTLLNWFNLRKYFPQSGASDFVTKPWDNRELIRVLKDAIDANTEVVPFEKMEEEHVRKVVDKCHGNISRAAELLEISRQRLYKKLGK